MSLKVFHFAFVTFSFLTAAFFGVWSLTTGIAVLPGAQVYGVGSLVAAGALFIYLIWVARKLSPFGFLALLLPLLTLSSPQEALACAVCYGNPDSAMVKGAAAGVFFLIGVVAVMLSAFGGLFLFWRHRARLQSTF